MQPLPFFSASCLVIYILVLLPFVSHVALATHRAATKQDPFVSPVNTRIEERAPVWGFDGTPKAAISQGGVTIIRVLGQTKN
jgi:hypothetical protein